MRRALLDVLLWLALWAVAVLAISVIRAAPDAARAVFAWLTDAYP